MLKAYKYRLYPTIDQQSKIDRTIGVCRLVYNLALETKNHAYQSARKKLSAIDLINQLPALKEAYPWMKDVDSQALQYAIRQVDSAFQKFFKGAGFPKYKSKHKSRLSFHAPNNKREVNWREAAELLAQIHAYVHKNMEVKLGQCNVKVILDRCKHFEQASALLNEVLVMNEMWGDLPSEFINKVKTFLDGSK